MCRQQCRDIQPCLILFPLIFPIPYKCVHHVCVVSDFAVTIASLTEQNVCARESECVFRKGMDDAE